MPAIFKMVFALKTVVGVWGECRVRIDLDRWYFLSPVVGLMPVSAIVKAWTLLHV